MSNLSTIQDVLLEAQSEDFFTGVPRHLPYRMVAGKVFICIGVRRCGKSTLLHQIISKLKQQGMPSENMLYVNFFDDRLEEIRRGNFDLLTEAYYGLYPEKKGQRGVHCFLDEVQMAKGWESFADRLQRSEKMAVYASGSSARLLAKEVGTAMRGRSLAWELFPFSFAEFLDARRIARDMRGQQARLRVRRGFDEYWERGGFPEVLDVEARLRVMIHQEYFRTMVFRDVVERNDALHPRAVRDVAYRLLNTAASMYTVNALTGYLKSLGHKVSKAFVGDVIEWFEDAYALFTVHLFDSSLNRQHVNPKKIYAVDHALVRSTTNGVLVNSGHLLENLVFIDARRRGRVLYYYRTAGGREVDFVWRGGDNVLRFVQVAERAPSGSDTRTRELTALREAMRECPKSRSFLVTRDDEDGLVKVPEGPIRVMPVWRYLIEEET